MSKSSLHSWKKYHSTENAVQFFIFPRDHLWNPNEKGGNWELLKVQKEIPKKNII